MKWRRLGHSRAGRVDQAVIKQSQQQSLDSILSQVPLDAEARARVDVELCAVTNEMKAVQRR